MVASKELRSQSIVPAQKLLNLLPRLGELLSNDGKETHSCMLWEWLHYPMIAFGTLWGQVLSKGVTSHEESERILEVSGCKILFLQTLKITTRSCIPSVGDVIKPSGAGTSLYSKTMPHAHLRQTLHNVPRFLERLESRHIIIGGKLKGITERIIHHVSAIHHASSPTQQRLSARDDTIETDQMQYRLQAIEPFDMPSTSTDATFNAPQEGLILLPDDFFLDPTFDWFSWGDQTIL
jgi:hypothetical protein